MRFFAVVKNDVKRILFVQEKIFCALPQLKGCKEVAILCTSILCPKNCPGGDANTFAFLLTQAPKEWQNTPPPPENRGS